MCLKHSFCTKVDHILAQFRWIGHYAVLFFERAGKQPFVRIKAQYIAEYSISGFASQCKATTKISMLVL
jgi:hypothetical protein